MSEKKKLVLSSKVASDALLKKVRDKQTAFGTNKGKTVTFEFKGPQQRRGMDRGNIQVQHRSEGNKEKLTYEELKMRMEALRGISDNEFDESSEQDRVEEVEALETLSQEEAPIEVAEDTQEPIFSEPVPEVKETKIEGQETTTVVEQTQPDTTPSEPEQPVKKPKSLDDFVRAAIAKETTPGIKPKSDPSQPSGAQDDRSNASKSAKSKVDKGTEKRQNKMSLTAMLEERAEKIRSMSAKKSSSFRGAGSSSRSRTGLSSKEVSVPEFITVQELANRAAVKASQIIKILFSMGMPVTITKTIDADTAEIVLGELGHTCKREQDLTLEEYVKSIKDGKPTKIEQRPPIVTVMGHVDHGKTSLLDTIRKTDVISTESGGITQHIGAYQITLNNGRKITFIDTPGHEAFTEMRSRGANTTDIVVLVVAADDGVKQQTVEAISHAKAAGVPIIVAINKIDKPGANPDRVREDLLNHGIVLEKFGGEVSDVEISAKKGTNIDKLEEMILLTSDLMELKANKVGYASGVIIEAQQKRGLGVVATVLVKDGDLRKGDVFVSGTIFGRVRSIMNDKGAHIKEAGPSFPVEVIGFEGVPLPGDDFVVLDDEAKAKEIAGYRERKYRESINAKRNKTSAERMFERLDDEKLTKVSVIVKADVQGSVEAIVSSLAKFSNDEVEVDVVYSAMGEITENDVILAKASNAIIFGFNVRANSKARDKAKMYGTEIFYHSIVYDLIEDVKHMISGALSPEIKEEVTGHAEIRQVFSIFKIGTVAGCMVKDGIIKRNSKARLLRENVVIYDSFIKSLRIGKNDTKEVKENYECGIVLDSYQDVKEHDVIETYEIREFERTIN